MKFLLIAVLLFSGVVMAQVDQKAKHPAPQNQKQDSNSAPKPSTPPCTPQSCCVCNPATDAKAGDSKEEKHGWVYEGFGPPTWPNWLLVAVGIFAGWVGLRSLKVIEQQGVQMKRQADEMVRQEDILKDSVEAAQLSAFAAKKSAEALVNSERPWIVIKVERVAAARSFRFIAVNRGRTPAEIITADLNFNSIATDTQDVPDEPVYGKYGLAHRPLITPDMTWSSIDLEFDVGHLLDNDPETRDNITSSRKRLIIWGRIAYVDALGETTEPQPLRETRFCYFYSPATQSLLPGGKPGYNQHT